MIALILRLFARSLPSILSALDRLHDQVEAGIAKEAARIEALAVEHSDAMLRHDSGVAILRGIRNVLGR